jgi:hypothetical protein
LRPDIYSATALFTERYGIEAAAEIVRFEISHLKLVEELVRKENIDCDLTFTRSYDMYVDEDELKKAKAFYDFLIEQGLDFMDDVQYMSQAEAQDVSGISLRILRSFSEYLLTIFSLRQHMLETPREASAFQQAISGLTNSLLISFGLPFPMA